MYVYQIFQIHPYDIEHLPVHEAEAAIVTERHASMISTFISQGRRALTLLHKMASKRAYDSRSANFIKGQTASHSAHAMSGLCDTSSPLKRSLDQDDCKGSPLYKKQRGLPHFELLSDEILLHILGFLSFSDVCRIQAVDRQFSRLSSDTVLWKRLYRSDFPNRPYNRLSTAASPLLKKRRLGTINSQDHLTSPGVDWKKRYQVRSNWSIGRCRAVEGDAGTRTTPDLRCSLSYDQSRTFALVAAAGIAGGSCVLKGPIEAGHDQFLLYSSEALHIYKVGFPPTCSATLVLPLIKKILYQAGFVAILTQANKLLIFDIEGVALISPNPVATFHGSAVHNVAFHTRLLDDNVIFSLSFTEVGLFSTTIRVQEVLLSKTIRSQINTRIATSTSLVPELLNRWQNSTIAGEIVYDHPYLLVPSSNNIYLHVVLSKPSSLSLTPPKVLHGYTSMVNSCSVNKSLRFVVGLGRAGLRIWDLNFNTHGVAVSHEEVNDMLDDDASREIISTSETKVIALADSGRIILHDFAV